jgi:uncharacterized protein (TIGR03437 family)
MTRTPKRFTIIVSIACFGFSAAYAQRNRLPGAIDSSSRTTLTGRVHPQARAQNDNGRVEDSFELPGMTLVLKPSTDQQTALRQLLQELQDPSSPNYHQWLTPEQYADRFGASQSDIDQIRAWLQQQGFTVNGVARGRSWVTFSGNAAQVRSAFGTEIHRYRVNGAAHFANATDPSVPAALAPLVGSFRGLNDFHPQPRLRAPHPQLNGSNGSHQLGPGDIAMIYNIKPLYDAGVDGTGQKIAVVGQTAIQTSDIQSFRTKFNLGTANVTQVLAQRPSPGIVDGDIDEANLDIEWSGAIARNATIVYVYSTDVWTSAMYAVDNNVAPVISMSYGLCESGDLVDLVSEQQVAQQANAQGMTWFAASGDAGAADCDEMNGNVAQNGFSVDAPASIPEVTAMGGTEFNEQGGSYWAGSNDANGVSALSYIPERVWNDSVGQLAAGGGGSSIFFLQPSWQTGAGVPSDGARHVPDLSLASSAEHDGYYVFTTGSAATFGGTSVAAPIMAGVTALLNHYLVSNVAIKQPGLGNINPTLYRLAANHPAAFHDITTGDNAVPCAAGTPNCVNGTVGHSAGPNYDLASGLGSVDATELVHQWASFPARNSAVAISSDQNPVFQHAPDAQGNAWTLTLTLTEDAGIGTTLTGITIDGVNYTSQISSLFGGAAIAPGGSISAGIGFKGVTVPKTVVFVFTGVDASGATWTNQISLPFQGPQPVLAIGGISNAASGQQVYAPGMLLSVYGTGMGDIVQSAAAIPLPTYLAGFEASINGVSAPLYYVSPNQVNIQIPYETNPGTATLVVGNPYVNKTFRFTVSSAGPGIFTFADGAVNPSRSGARGQTVTLFVTGEGAVSPSLATGDTPSSRTPLANLPKPRQTVTVTVGGVPANLQFVGIPSGLVGVTQINFTIPQSAPTGSQQVVVTVGTAASNTATITVQ